MRTVRDAVFDVLAHHGVRRMYANPGSTEVDFLTDLTPDIEKRIRELTLGRDPSEPPF